MSIQPLAKARDRESQGDDHERKQGQQFIPHAADIGAAQDDAANQEASKKKSFYLFDHNSTRLRRNWMKIGPFESYGLYAGRRLG